MADSSTPDSSLPDSSNSSPPNYSLPDSSMNDIIVKLAEDRAASLPEDRWLSASKPPSIWNLAQRRSSYYTGMYPVGIGWFSLLGFPAGLFAVFGDVFLFK
nr:hypothetical protein Iba_chr04aCG13640 [Ipomoea batatas]